MVEMKRAAAAARLTGRGGGGWDNKPTQGRGGHSGDGFMDRGSPRPSHELVDVHGIGSSNISSNINRAEHPGALTGALHAQRGGNGNLLSHPPPITTTGLRYNENTYDGTYDATSYGAGRATENSALDEVRRRGAT